MQKKIHKLKHKDWKITGVGIDIESVERFRNRALATHPHFYEKIFTDKEIAYCKTHKDPYPHFAARFCVKEAAVKALGRTIDFKKMEVKNDAYTGAPSLFIKNANTVIVRISLSHTKDNAIAIVIAMER